MRKGALPTPRLPYNPEDAARGHLEGEVPERGGDPRSDFVVHGEILDAQQRLDHGVTPGHPLPPEPRPQSASARRPASGPADPEGRGGPPAPPPTSGRRGRAR